MIPMLRLQFIIFSLISIGFYTRKKGMVSREGQKNITDLVLNIVLPCNIITSYIQELPDSALRDCATVFLISVGAETMCMLYARFAYRKIEEQKRKCLTYGMLVSNAGFLGNPVAEGVFGPMGLMLASVYLIPVRIIMWSRGIAIFSGESDRRATVKKVLTHPCVIACLVGVLIMLADIFLGIAVVPEWILSLLQTVGRCNTALSMLVIGMILSDIDLSQLMDRTVLRYTFERLLLIPGMLAAVLFVLSRFGLFSWGLAPRLPILLQAMPAAATTSMLASKYDCAPQFATKMVITSTLLSIPSIFIWGLLLKGAG